MLKKTKLYSGITLFVQAFSFLTAFIMLCKKKKGLANGFLAIAAIGGAVGASLIYLNSKDELKRRKFLAAGGAYRSPYPYGDSDMFFDIEEYEDADGL